MGAVGRNGTDHAGALLTPYELHVHTGNFGAVRFYQRHGYERCARVPEFYGPVDRDAYLYRKTIAARSRRRRHRWEAERTVARTLEPGRQTQKADCFTADNRALWKQSEALLRVWCFLGALRRLILVGAACSCPSRLFRGVDGGVVGVGCGGGHGCAFGKREGAFRPPAAAVRDSGAGSWTARAAWYSSTAFLRLACTS